MTTWLESDLLACERVHVDTGMDSSRVVTGHTSGRREGQSQSIMPRLQAMLHVTCLGIKTCIITPADININIRRSPTVNDYVNFRYF